MPTKVLFIVRDFGWAYRFRSMFHHLVNSADRVHVAAEYEDHTRDGGLFEDLVRSLKRISYGKALDPEARFWGPLKHALRSGMVDAFLEHYQPNVLFIAPADEGSSQIDYIRSARGRGIRTVLYASRWDQFRSWGAFPVQPDCVAVWNRFQRREAVDILGVPPQNTVVIGAIGCDDFFDARAALSRTDVCARLGLSSSAPLFVFACGRNGDSLLEEAFLTQWLTGLREQPDERLRSAGVIIRLHPEDSARRSLDGFARFGNTAILGDQQKDLLGPGGLRADVEALESCDAVIGVDTAILFESGISGKPFFGITPKDRILDLTADPDALSSFSREHEEVAKDWLFLASGLDEHYAQLRRIDWTSKGLDPKTRIVVRSFLRPNGSAIPVGLFLMELFDEVVSHANASPVAGVSLPASLLRLGTYPLARAAMRFSGAAETSWWGIPRPRRSFDPAAAIAYARRYTTIARDQVQRKLRQLDHKVQKWGPKALRVAGRDATRWRKKVVRIVRVARYRAATLFRS